MKDNQGSILELLGVVAFVYLFYKVMFLFFESDFFLWILGIGIVGYFLFAVKLFFTKD